MVTPTRPPEALPERRRTGCVLVVDPDRDIAELVQAILTDEGYEVSCLYEYHRELLHTAVGRLEPDCVLLDSGGPAGNGAPWEEARLLGRRARAVPVVLFTAHQRDAIEAQTPASERSRAAGFSAVVLKPFQIENLLDAVARSVGRSIPFDRSPEADAARTAALAERLRRGGATDLHASSRREWVTFRAPSGRLVQIYWWQTRGVYYCGTYDANGATMEPRGTFTDVEAAVECALAL